MHFSQSKTENLINKYGELFLSLFHFVCRHEAVVAERLRRLARNQVRIRDRDREDILDYRKVFFFYARKMYASFGSLEVAPLKMPNELKC